MVDNLSQCVRQNILSLYFDVGLSYHSVIFLIPQRTEIVEQSTLLVWLTI